MKPGDTGGSPLFISHAILNKGGGGGREKKKKKKHSSTTARTTATSHSLNHSSRHGFGPKGKRGKKKSIPRQGGDSTRDTPG